MPPKKDTTNSDADSSPGSPSKTNSKTDSDSTSKSKLWDTLKGPAKYGTIIGLTITGLIFLPKLLIQQIGNTLFPFLPEEYRPLATAGLSCGSCCMLCCVLSVMLFMVMKN